MTEIPTCKVEGCERSSKDPGCAKGYCRFHYNRARKGVPLDAPVRVTKPYTRNTPGIRELEAAGLAPVRLCKVEGCEKGAYGQEGGAKGYCRAHYCKLRKYGDATVVVKVRNTCSIEDCEGVVEGHGLCRKHYMRMKRHGSTEEPKRPEPPNKGKGIRQLEAAGVVAKRTCKVGSCERWSGEPASGLGYCRLHYQRFVDNGTPYEMFRVFTICVVVDCKIITFGHGLCQKHYFRKKRHGSPDRLSPSRMNPAGMKWCPQCKSYRLVGDFNRAKWNRTGLASMCRGCYKQWRASWLAENPERKWVAPSTPENRAIWRERSKDYRRRNPEKVAASSKRWRQQNAEKVAIYRARRRARERDQATETFKPAEIFDRDHWMCGLCGEHIDSKLQYPHPMSVSLDHKMPLSKGGEHSRANTQAAHLTCNLRKHVAFEDHQAALF